MSRLPRLTAIAPVVVLLASVAPRLAAQEAGAIAGRVTAAGGAPLAGARVAVAGGTRAAVTDAAGAYRLGGLPAGAYDLVVTAAGRTPERRTVRVGAGAAGPAADFALAPAPPLLADVVVTASRAAEAPRAVAAAVHVLPAERVRTSPARATDDLVRELPGVELPRTSSVVSGPEQIVSVRGADEGRTLVLLDGVPLNDPWGEWIQWNRAPRYQLDRAEVFEGANSSLYGSSAMGGVIALQRRPIVARGYQVVAAGGSRGAFDGSAGLSDARGRLGWSLAGDYGTGGGYTLLRTPGAVDERSRSTRGGVTGRAELAVGAAGSVFATADYYADDRALGTALTAPNRRRIAAGTLGGSFGGVLGGRVEARAYGQDQTYDSRSSVVSAARATERPNVAQRIPTSDLGGSLAWSRAAGPFERLSVGADVRATRGRLDETVYSAAAGAPVAGTRTAGGDQQVGGAFVQGVFAPLPAVRVEASARVDAWRSGGGSRTDATVTPATTTQFATKSNRAFAPRVGVRWAILPSLALRGSYYQGFRAPTLSEEYRTFFAGPNTFQGNPALTPEYLTGFDGGVDWQPAPRAALRVTAFRNDYRDLDDFVFVRPGPTAGSAVLQRQNLGRSRASGAEAVASLALGGPFALAASYNYNDARVRSTGVPINRVPLQRGTARLTVDEPRVAALNVVYRYEGPNHALGGLRLAPFATVDVDVRRHLLGAPAAGAEVFVAAENLLDRTYLVNRQGTLEYVGLPRTVRGGVAVRSF